MTKEPGLVGVVGLGLMGQGIAACLLSRGFRVLAYNRTFGKAQRSLRHIGETLDELVERKVVGASAVKNWRGRYGIVRSLSDLGACTFVIETVREDLPLKRRIYDQLEAAVPATTIIASNTSSFPVSLLQGGRTHPERFIGMHWGEPAAIMPYLEITRGKSTGDRALRLTKDLGLRCGKHPSVLSTDVRGFVSNRLMYAMMREACYLVERGVADIETVDRSFRNDIGWWATIAGPFRWMDLTGIPAYAAVMKGLFPELCVSRTVPRMVKAVVARRAEGISNGKGFYKYTRTTVKAWKAVWTDFTYDLHGLVRKYEQRVKF